jgi:DNA-binding transcriptional LysR family regulator
LGDVRETDVRRITWQRLDHLLLIQSRQLLFAVEAADAASFQRAAAKLNVKQSTLSRTIADLEIRLGVVLFERTTRGAVPTDNGRAFIVTDIENLRTTAKAVRYGEIGRLMVAFSNSLTGGGLRLVLGDLLERSPDIQLDVAEAGGDAMASGLQARTVDIAFHGESLALDGVLKRPLWSERLMLALPPGHRLIEQDEIFWTDLRREIFVVSTLGDGPVISGLIRHRLAGQGYDANIIVQQTRGENILSMVSYGKFLTVVADSGLGSQQSDIVFREISEPTGVAHLSIAAWWLADNHNPALKRFLRLLDERYPT